MSSPRPIELRSDNAAGAAPEILGAIAEANVGSAMAYGEDDWTARLHVVVGEVFQRDDVTVHPVVSGTAANSLALAAVCPPWGSVLCHASSHIVTNECGATSLFGGGAVMRPLPGDDYRVHPDGLSAALADTRWGDNHASQPSVLSLTQPSDYGTVYRPSEIADLAALAGERGMRVHVDGARLANAVATLGCHPAEVTWRAGVNVVSLGAIKNGGLSCDAIVSFDERASAELYYRLKRAGHVSSKMRFQAAQLIAYLSDDLWLRNAAVANAATGKLVDGLGALGVECMNRADVNIVFARVADDVADRLEASGLLFYRIGPGVVRFVTSFKTTDADVDEALSRLRDAL
jgi:threonine aldolase